MKAKKDAIETAMARACMCRRDISTKTGMPVSTVRNVIQGRNVRPPTLGKVAAALGCDVSELLADSEEARK